MKITIEAENPNPRVAIQEIKDVANHMQLSIPRISKYAAQNPIISEEAAQQPQTPLPSYAPHEERKVREKRVKLREFILANPNASEEDLIYLIRTHAMSKQKKYSLKYYIRDVGNKGMPRDNHVVQATQSRYIYLKALGMPLVQYIKEHSNLSIAELVADIQSKVPETKEYRILLAIAKAKGGLE